MVGFLLSRRVLLWLGLLATLCVLLSRGYHDLMQGRPYPDRAENPLSVQGGLPGGRSMEIHYRKRSGSCGATRAAALRRLRDGQRSARWLLAHGFQLPPVVQVDLGCGADPDEIAQARDFGVRISSAYFNRDGQTYMVHELAHVAQNCLAERFADRAITYTDTSKAWWEEGQAAAMETLYGHKRTNDAYRVPSSPDLATQAASYPTRPFWEALSVRQNRDLIAERCRRGSDIYKALFKVTSSRERAAGLGRLWRFYLSDQNDRGQAPVEQIGRALSYGKRAQVTCGASSAVAVRVPALSSRFVVADGCSGRWTARLSGGSAAQVTGRRAFGVSAMTGTVVAATTASNGSAVVVAVSNPTMRTVTAKLDLSAPAEVAAPLKVSQSVTAADGRHLPPDPIVYVYRGWLAAEVTAALYAAYLLWRLQRVIRRRLRR